MKKYIKQCQSFIEGFLFGINSTNHSDREIQEGWNTKVLKNKESYEIFYSWMRGYILSKKTY